MSPELQTGSVVTSQEERDRLGKRFNVLAKKAKAFFEEAGGGIVEGTAPCRLELGATLRGTEGVGRRYSTRAS